jgi:Carboxypeptidase regulatory-like domain
MAPLRLTIRIAALAVLVAAAAGARDDALLAAGQQVEIRMNTSVGGPPGPSMAPVEETGTGLIVGQVVDAGTGRPVPGAVVTLGGGGTGGEGPTRVMVMAGGPPPPPPSSDSNRQVPRILTGAEGRFVFQNLPKGTFNILAAKPGYSEGAYGRLRPDGPVESLALEDGQRRGDVTIRLFRQASISGTVTDDLGEPVVGADVRAYRRSLVAGRRLLSPVRSTAQTDDRGIYRLGGLEPGEYVIAVPTVESSVPAGLQLKGPIPPDLVSTLASPSNSGFSIRLGGSQVTPEGKFLLQDSSGTSAGTPLEIGGRLMVHPTEYYPASRTAADATAITVQSGEDRSGIDLSLKLEPTANISGRLMGPDGPAANFALHLVPSDTGDLSADPDVATAITDADGTFAFLAVPAGQYVIQTVRVPRPTLLNGVPMTVMLQAGGGTMAFSAVQSGGRGPAPVPPSDPTLWVSAPVSISADDVTGLNLTLSTGFSVTGRVEFQGSANPPTAQMLQFTGVTAEPADGKLRVRALPGHIDASGTFTIPGLLPGQYVIQATNVPGPGGWRLKSAMLGGVDVADVPLTIGNRDVGDVTLTFGDTTTGITGTVTNRQGGADSAAAVVAFPANSQLWRDYGSSSRRMRLARTTGTGAFSIRGLPAGDYNVIAISEEFAGEWQDPQFLELMSHAATRVTLGDGQQARQDLTTQAVRPPGGRSQQPAVSSADDGSPTDGYDAASPGGPYVPDEAAPQRPVRDPARPPAAPTRPQTPRDVAARPVTGTGTISGVVLEDDGSNQPVRRARVIVRGSDQVAERATATDDSGRFSLPALPPGHYTLTVSKPAYVSIYYGASHPGKGPGLPITLTDGQALTGLTIRLPHGAVITGTVTDDFGMPVADVSVRVMQFETTGQERRLVPAGLGRAEAQTDDRGRYRIYDLTAGTYVVAVMPPLRLGSPGDLRQLSADDIATALADVQQPNRAPAGTGGMPPAPGQTSRAAPAAPTGHSVGYAPVYYPGTLSPDQATSVTVTAGQEQAGIDIPMHVVPTARLDGIVLEPNGQPASGVRVSILPSGPGPLIFTGLSMTRSSRDGTFSAQNLAPGHYTILAQAADPSEAPPPLTPPSQTAPPPPSPPPPPGGSRSGRGGGITFVQQRLSLWAQQDLDINGTDVTGLSLTLQPGMTISGRVVFASPSLAPPADLSEMQVSLRASRQSPGISLGVPPAQVDSTGHFAFAGVPPGHYMVVAEAPGGTSHPTWWLKSATVDNRDTLDSSLDVEPGQNVQGLVLTFSDQTTELSGRLIDQTGKPAPGLSILVFSTDRSFWTPGSRRVARPVRTASDGTYRTTGLPAGEYYLAAVPDLDPSQVDDPTFLEQVVPAAIRITLTDGEKKVEDLRIGGHTGG